MIGTQQMPGDIKHLYTDTYIVITSYVIHAILHEIKVEDT